jgi:hypothetical protein
VQAARDENTEGRMHDDDLEPLPLSLVRTWGDITTMHGRRRPAAERWRAIVREECPEHGPATGFPAVIGGIAHCADCGAPLTDVRYLRER